VTGRCLADVDRGIIVTGDVKSGMTRWLRASLDARRSSLAIGASISSIRIDRQRELIQTTTMPGN